MIKVDYAKIDKTKFLSLLWTSLHDMAFLDIKRASDGESKMGAFILASCFIDYLAGFRYGKENNGNDYKNIVKKYLAGKYDAKKLYRDLRSRLVHNYTEGGSYMFVHDHSELHKLETPEGKVVLNLENFIADIEDVLKAYFNELRNDEKIYKLALDRYFKLGALGVRSTLVLKNSSEAMI